MTLGWQGGDLELPAVGVIRRHAMLNAKQAESSGFRWPQTAQFTAPNGAVFSVSPYSMRNNLDSLCQNDGQRKTLRVYMVANAERTVSHLLSELEVESLFGADANRS
jgi:hypothetical protein